MDHIKEGAAVADAPQTCTALIRRIIRDPCHFLYTPPSLSFFYFYFFSSMKESKKGGEKVTRSLQDDVCLVRGRFSREKTFGTARMLVTRNIPPQCQSYVTHFEKYQHARAHTRTHMYESVGLRKKKKKLRLSVVLKGPYMRIFHFSDLSIL